MLELNQKLLERIEKDVEKVEKKYQQNVVDTYNSAYRIAMLQNIEQTFLERVFNGDYDVDLDSETVYEEETMLSMINYNGNILEAIVDDFFNYNHPERYDFWGYYNGYEGTKEIIDNWIQDTFKTNEEK